MGLIHDTKFIASEEIPLNSAELIKSVKPPIKKNTLKLLYKALTARHAAVWNTHLESLMVQRKFIDLIPLESESRVWSRIITSLPAGLLFSTPSWYRLSSYPSHSVSMEITM